MAKKYCTVTDIENYLQIDIEDSFESQVESWIDGVSRLMDKLACRVLVADLDASDEVKYYDGKDCDFITIDDCQSVTTLQIGDVYGENMDVVTGYIKYPKTAPYRKIFLKSDIFPTGMQNVAVTGKFGYLGAVPADLTLACAIITAGIINNQNKGNQTKKSESIGNYSVSYIDDKGVADYAHALDIISGYRKLII